MRLRYAVAPIALLALVGCGSEGSGAASEKPSPSPASEAPEVFTVPATLTLTDPGGFFDDGPYCQGRDGYDDLKVGAQVIVRDASGTQVALGELRAGRLQPDRTCAWSTTVYGVPDSSDIYTIEIASRGEVSFTRKDAEARNVQLTLG